MKDVNTWYFIMTGYLFSIGLSVVVFITFIYAYFINHGVYAFTIDRYGEADVEMLLLIIVLSIICYGFYRFIRRDVKS